MQAPRSSLAAVNPARVQCRATDCASDKANLPVGSRLDVYQIEGVLGTGGFGITYKARDTCLRMSVAIKEYFPSDIVDRADGSTVTVTQPNYKEMFRWGLDRFIGEGQILARFKHPNIVRVSRYLSANSTGYIVMDFEEGELLSDYLARLEEPPDQRVLLGIFVPILHGLGEVHKREVLHLDIKPANIFLRHDGAPVLLDFGAARFNLGQAGVEIDDGSQFTPGYAPPEQSLGAAHCTAASDVYSLGATLYRCIAGFAPPPASLRLEELAARRADPYVQTASMAKRRYSRALLRSVDQMLRLGVAERPASIGTVLGEIGAPRRSRTAAAKAQLPQSAKSAGRRPVLAAPDAERNSSAAAPPAVIDAPGCGGASSGARADTGFTVRRVPVGVR